MLHGQDLRAQTGSASRQRIALLEGVHYMQDWRRLQSGAGSSWKSTSRLQSQAKLAGIRRSLWTASMGVVRTLSLSDHQALVRRSGPP